jgi:hypothetical protein
MVNPLSRNIPLYNVPSPQASSDNSSSGVSLGSEFETLAVDSLDYFSIANQLQKKAISDSTELARAKSMKEAELDIQAVWLRNAKEENKWITGTS